MIKDANKISIIGGPGSGKSTLARNLGNELNLPVCHLDSIHHLDNWKIRDKQERNSIILEKMSQPKWIMDGTYRDTLEIRLNNSDFIIFLDYSTFSEIKGILIRYFQNKNKEKPDIPGCKEKISLHFLWFTIKWNCTKRSFIIKILKKVGNKDLLIFKNRKKLNKWYENEFNKKITKKIIS